MATRALKISTEPACFGLQMCLACTRVHRSSVNTPRYKIGEIVLPEGTSTVSPGCPRYASRQIRRPMVYSLCPRSAGRGMAGLADLTERDNPICHYIE